MNRCFLFLLLSFINHQIFACEVLNTLHEPYTVQTAKIILPSDVGLDWRKQSVEQGPKAYVQFQLSNRGTPIEIKIAQSSRHKVFDKAAKVAMRKFVFLTSLPKSDCYQKVFDGNDIAWGDLHLK